MTPRPSESLTARSIILLVAITLVAAALRLPSLTISPPGLQHDEASNAWNTYCLLETGRDASGDAWPIFCTRALGEYRSALFYYFLLPFQAVGGLNVTTTRLPGAVFGVISIPLMFYVARRLFGTHAAFLAAMLLAINGWHIQQNRIGHEAAIVPFLVLLSLSLAMAARLPFAAAEKKPIIPLAALAGLVWGASCYGYPGIRLFLPTFLLLAIILGRTHWRRFLASRGGAAATIAFALGLAATIGPLLYMHIAHPEQIAKRGTTTWVWSQAQSPTEGIIHVVMRYLLHFGPDFLFISGDRFEPVSPALGGQLPWYSIPLLILGAARLVQLGRQDPSKAVVWAGVLAYPIGDTFNSGASLHTYRSFSGLPALILLAAVGAEDLRVRLSQLRPLVRRSILVAGCSLIAIEAGAFYSRLMSHFPRQMNVFHFYKVDLIEACKWLEPRLDDAERVYFTMDHFNMSYMPLLVTLNYDPRQWFADEPDIRPTAVWDYCYGFNKFRFLQGQAPMEAYEGLRRSETGKTVYFVVRPEELPAHLDPVHIIRRPSGEPCLMIYEMKVSNL